MGKPIATAQQRSGARGRTAVAVLVEGGRRGAVAVDRVHTEAADGALDVTLLAVLAHAQNSGCTMSAEPLNDAVREAAEQQLAVAAAALNARGVASRQVFLRAHDTPSLADWASSAGISTILLPGRTGPWRRARTHPAAGALRRAVSMSAWSEAEYGVVSRTCVVSRGLRGLIRVRSPRRVGALGASACRRVSARTGLCAALGPSAGGCVGKGDEQPRLLTHPPASAHVRLAQREGG